jgi:hypothetical protein
LLRPQFSTALHMAQTVRDWISNGRAAANVFVNPESRLGAIMKTFKTIWLAGLWSLIAACIPLSGPEQVSAQPRGPRWDRERQADMAVFQYLLDQRKEITRKVTNIPTGVETLTESENREVAAKLAVHVEAMHERLRKGRPIHMRDPLFREIFRHADKIKLTIEKTPKGVKVSETSNDAYVAKLIQAHAEVLNQFLAKGHEEVRKNHPVPGKERGS